MIHNHQAIEMAAKALYATACKQRGFRNDIDEVWESSEFRENCMAGLADAIAAYFASMKAQGLAFDDEMDWTTSIEDGNNLGVQIEHNVPVTIISLKTTP